MRCRSGSLTDCATPMFEVRAKYPILVEHLKSDQALLIVCYEGCRWEMTITPDGIRNEQNYLCSQCHGPAGYKYEEADHKCPNCGKLGFFPDACKPCCSRVCMLQTEWAQELERRKMADAGEPTSATALTPPSATPAAASPQSPHEDLGGPRSASSSPHSNARASAECDESERPAPVDTRHTHV